MKPWILPPRHAIKQTHRDPSRRRCVRPILAGLACAQILATLYVGQSNQHVLATSQALTEAGWFAIPAGQSLETLNTFSAAFWGGLFFTLSIGAGLALPTWGLRAGIPRRAAHHRFFRPALIFMWLIPLAMVNYRGFSLFPSLFVLGVPAATWWMTGRSHSQDGGEAPVLPWSMRVLPVGVLVLLTALWATQLDERLFTAIRDHILLSNPVGRRVNDFYYRYTLHAAEAFKSFEQKTIRTANMDAILDPVLKRRLSELLAARDILVLPAFKPVDLTFTVVDGQLRLQSGGSAMRTTVRPEDFRDRADTVLKEFSAFSDHDHGFRILVFGGLLIGFPCLLYFSVYVGLRRLAGLLLDQRPAMLTASGLCLAVGIGLLIPVAAAGRIDIPASGIETALRSDQWPIRVAALRHIERHKMDIADHPFYRERIGSFLAVERLYLARALAVSRSNQTYPDILELLRDPHPNVVCQAYYALGKRGNPSAIALIQKSVSGSDHWYSQWYGYRAMRRLGWQQQPRHP